MTTRSLKIYLHDIAAAIHGIEEAAVDQTFASFTRNAVLMRATERWLEIISEASRKIPDDLLAEHPTIPWRNIRDLGNVLRHAYHKVEAERLWEIVQTDLPALGAAIAAMRAKL